MTLFNIDARRVKLALKHAVGAKESDFNGQKMMCGTTVNPVAVVSPNDLIVKTTAAITNTALVWTPDTGKTIRLLGGSIVISKEAACAGALTLGIKDNIRNVQFLFYAISNAALVATGNVIVIPFNLPDSGYLMYNNSPLEITFSAALTAGAVTCQAWGYEE